MHHWKFIVLHQWCITRQIIVSKFNQKGKFELQGQAHSSLLIQRCVFFVLPLWCLLKKLALEVTKSWRIYFSKGQKKTIVQEKIENATKPEEFLKG